MAWTDLTFAFASKLTSTKMTQMDDNFDSLAAGDSGAPVVIGASLVFLSSQVISNDATIDFTSGIDSAYPLYIFDLMSVFPVTAGAHLYMRVSQSSTFLTTSYNYYHNNDKMHATPGTDAGGSNNTSVARMTATSGVGNTAQYSLSGRVYLFDPGGGVANPKFSWRNTYVDSAGESWDGRGGAYNFTGVTAVDGFRFYFNTGNMSGGTIRMYGVKGA